MIRIVLVCVVFALSAAEGFGQTLGTLYTFGSLSNQVGVNPAAPLLLGPDGLLYGSTSEPFGSGIVRGALFKISTNGSGLTAIKQFTNSLDGSSPQGRLLLDGDTLLGLTTREGALGGGTIFRIKTNGNNFSVLLALPADSFTGTNKFGNNDEPVGGLTLGGATLFGVTPTGGKSNYGTIFRVNKDGNEYRVLKEFLGTDGARPCGDLALSGTMLFGTTSYADPAWGTVFRINTDGSDFAVLKRFEQNLALTEGATPYGGLILADGTLYGTTFGGGSYVWRGMTSTWSGVIFKMKDDGTDFQALHSIEPLDILDTLYSLGRGPVGTLVLSGDQLYGVTAYFGNGFLAPGPSVFRIKTDGTEFSLHAGTMGQRVSAGVTLVNGVPFGTAYRTDYLMNSNAVGHIYRSDGIGRATMLYPFGAAGESGVNSITRAGDYFYGTTIVGGSASGGTIFRARANGSDLSVLFSFPAGTNGDTPRSRLTILGTNIFGVAHVSPGYDLVLYRIGIDGTGYKLLHRFPTAPDYLAGRGERPPFVPAPVVFNGAIYGALANIGATYGVIFRINPDGSGYRVIKEVQPADGYHPGELTVGNDAIYGVTLIGGSHGRGTFYRITTADQFFVLHHFDGIVACSTGRLLPQGDDLFGVVNVESTNGEAQSRIFKIRTDGTAFTLLGAVSGDASRTTLALNGNFLYGVTHARTGVNGGAIFQVTTNGTDPSLIHEFPLDGGNVRLDGELLPDENGLFGSTFSGGVVGQGTIFRLDLSPRLEITKSSTGAAISWPSSALGFVLQTATNLGAWTPVAGSELVHGTSVQTTNVSSFFRLLREP